MLMMAAACVCSGRFQGSREGIKCRVDTLQICCNVNGLIYYSIP